MRLYRIITKMKMDYKLFQSKQEQQSAAEKEAHRKKVQGK